jgi:hypothetical protein
MEAMTDEQVRKWCPQAGLKATTRFDILRYKQKREHKFFITAPEEHRAILYLARVMLIFRDEVQFSGGLVWLQQWNIGSPPLVSAGWRILEDMRRAHGELRSLEIAPAQSFREDEIVELHAFLIQVIAFGWRADFIPFFGEFFLHFKPNRQICITAKSPKTLKELRDHFQQWNPTDEDPMLVKMAAMAKARRKPGSGLK